MRKHAGIHTIRGILLVALAAAVLSCTTVFYSVNASGEQDAVTPSDAVSDDGSEAASETGSEVVFEVASEAVSEDDGSEIVIEVFHDTEGAKNLLFKQNAVYNGSYKSELLDDEVLIYNALYTQCITNCSDAAAEVDFTGRGYKTDEISTTVADLIRSAFFAFAFDHPEVFWISSFRYSVSYRGDEIIKVSVLPIEAYPNAFSDVTTVYNGITTAVNEIRSSRLSASRYDTAKAIHDYICNNAQYDYDVLSGGAYAGDHAEDQTAAPLFGGGRRGKKFVCEGYSESFKILCDRFGVPCAHVVSQGHAWDYVQMENGRWYAVDTTWDDSETSPIIYNYFLVGANTCDYSGRTFRQTHPETYYYFESSTIEPFAYPSLCSDAYPTVAHAVDSNYPTDFEMRAKARIKVFGPNHENVGEHYIEAGAVCTIHEVYTDGCCRVSYPTSDGTTTYYSEISNFEDNTLPVTYDVTPNINGGASKLYEPWGLRYYAAFSGADINKISDRGIAILKETYYTGGMTPEQFCANENVNIFLSSRNELAFEKATSSNPNGRYFATLTKGIYSYDISAKYYVVPFAVMNDGQTIYGSIKSNSMENILKANLKLPTITATEKAICTCILELKESVAAHYQAAGVPGASIDMNIPRGSSQSAASVATAAESGITPNVVGGASRLIEPWGLRYFATYTDSSDIAQRGMVILNEKYYQSSYSTSPDQMRLNAKAYVFRDSDGTLLKQSGSNRYYGTVTEGISSKDIADVYYVVPFAVLKNGKYVYGTVKSNSMMKIMNANLNSSSVPATERAVSQDIINLYNAVKAYYEAQ